MHKFAYLYQPFFIGFKNLSQLVLIYSCSLCDHQRLTNYIREFRFEGVSCVSSSSSQQIFAQNLRQHLETKISHIRNIRSAPKAFLIAASDFFLGALLPAVGEHFLVFLLAAGENSGDVLLVCLKCLSFIMFTTDPEIRKTHYQI